MQAGARLQSAIDVLSEIEGRGRQAPLVLEDWGRSHRFAGSSDRAWIGNLVYDVLRRKQSLAHRMQRDTPRAAALAALHWTWKLSGAEIATLCSGEAFCPAPLTEQEGERLDGLDAEPAAPWIEGDYPEWLHSSFHEVFGDAAVAEGRALAGRAPIDLRVNSLKAVRGKVLKVLSRHAPQETRYSPAGVRIFQRGERAPNVEADPGHQRGWFEIQDEGSQIASLLAGAGPRLQVADICAGAGGKTLAMAALMQNTGQIYAYDANPVRFKPIFARLKRAGVRNVQTLQPGQIASLKALEGRMDLVLIDAPCSGTGVWRRRPDAKWRLTPAKLESQLATQRELLSLGARLVRPGGALTYVTCSVLPQENERQIEAFLAANPEFSADSLAASAACTLSKPVENRLGSGSSGWLLTPASHGTDGFYIAGLQKSGGSTPRK
jgi:16S rRNA (cytosine967-C5)-methyltransferase